MKAKIISFWKNFIGKDADGDTCETKKVRLKVVMFICVLSLMCLAGAIYTEEETVGWLAFLLCLWTTWAAHTYNLEIKSIGRQRMDSGYYWRGWKK